MPILLQPAFVLHRRPYRETSLIVELFTRDYGRVAAVARGLRKARSRHAGVLQPFVPLLVSWYGKGELVNLSQMEVNGVLAGLSSKNLRCGFYLNELLVRLLAKNDPHAQLFDFYHKTIKELLHQSDITNEKLLRLFEKKLLFEIGYGLPQDCSFNEQNFYYFDLERGFLPYSTADKKAATISTTAIFQGKILNALLNEHFEEPVILRDIKRLMRLIFSLLLGGQSLQSRRLFE